jgi:hypothetical protein
MLRFPELSKPDRTPVRTVMGFDEGRRVEEWFSAVLAQAYPDLVGLRQEPFYFPVDLPEPWMLDDRAAQIQARSGRRLWGTVAAGFRPPAMRVGEDGRVKLRLLSNKKMGFVLDPPRAVVWVPTYLDFALLHPRHGLLVLEAKSLSNFAFRRAVVGTLDYGKRAQIAGIRAATGLPVALVGYRKETHHLAEICYLVGAGQTRVVLTRPNGTQEVFFPEGEGLRPAAGGAATWPAEATWEQAQCEVWTPDDPAMLAAIGARVRRVLFARPGEWHREYGPDFSCEKCGGAGSLACRHCKGTGITAKLGAGRGALQDAELGYPCSYCPVVATCWQAAGLRLELDTKPHFYVSRAPYQAAGLTFTPPEGA